MWKLIESAPEGEILLFEPPNVIAVGFQVSKDSHPIDPADFIDGVRWVASCCSPYADYHPPLRPTHWMKLPKKPE